MVNRLYKIQVYLMLLCLIFTDIQSAEAKHHIGDIRHYVNHTKQIITSYRFNSFSIVDLSAVDVYLVHEKCNGDLGHILFYTPLSEDMSNVEVSLDGGSSYVKPLLDNFGNVVITNVEVGTYEIYIRSTNGDQEDRFLGNYEILENTKVDLDNDGLTACIDVNDNDPCIPNDCDLSLGLGCDLTVNKNKTYEYCHFENILDPKESAYLLALDLTDEEGYVSYTWSTGDTTAVASMNPISNTTYYVTISDQSGCIFEDSVHVIVHFVPQVDIDIRHIGCNNEPSVMTLFSPIGEDLSNVELSMDGGINYFTPTFDNFGNIAELGLAEGNYNISIRHKDHPQCDKILDNINIRQQSFFDEDEDGVNYCDDPDDDDMCVPLVCENCDRVNKTDFEDDTETWTFDSDDVIITAERSISGQRSIQLINDGTSITSEEFELEEYMSIKFQTSIYPNSLEFEENISLLQSIDGGQTFIEIESWSALIDFTNGNWFDIKYNGPTPEDASTIIFRLMLNANSSNDDIFIDNIEIELCEIQYSESESIECDIVNYDDVDGFRGFWTFGGPDALLSTKYANSGQFSYHLQNGNGTSSSIISTPFSIPTAGELTVSFVYTPISMERTEFFALEVSTNNGLSYVPYHSWISGNFVNEDKYEELVSINFQDPEADIRIRFTCHANSQYDHIYLDDIKIEFCSDGQNGQQDNQIDLESEKETDNNGLVENKVNSANIISIGESTINDSKIDINIFPNPTSDEVQFSIPQSKELDKSVTVLLMQIDGTLVQQFSSTLHRLTTIDLRDLSPGLYIIQVYDQRTIIMNEKLVKL